MNNIDRVIEILDYHWSLYHDASEWDFEAIAKQICASQWISVEDELPVLNTEVLISLRGCDSGKRIVRTGERVNESDHDWESDGYEIANCWDLTHWQPMLELPNKD